MHRITYIYDVTCTAPPRTRKAVSKTPLPTRRAARYIRENLTFVFETTETSVAESLAARPRTPPSPRPRAIPTVLTTAQ
eukprot:1926410-Prymnesium_polylepis.1